jgi:hypothetical protein
MKKHILLIIFSALSLSVIAQDETGIETVKISPEPAITVPAKLYKMWPEEFQQYKGAYDLSNGMTLSIINRGRAMFARLNNQEWHEIVAISPNEFVSLDRQLKMRIDIRDNGDVSGEVLMPVSPGTQNVSAIYNQYHAG